MRVQRLLQKSIAFLLLLLFAVKSVGGLMLHNHFHAEKNPVSPCHTHHATIQAEGGACYCVDEFLQAYKPESQPQLFSSFTYYPVQRLFIAEKPVLFLTHVSALRGPPSLA